MVEITWRRLYTLIVLSVFTGFSLGTYYGTGARYKKTLTVLSTGASYHRRLEKQRKNAARMKKRKSQQPLLPVYNPKEEMSWMSQPTRSCVDIAELNWCPVECPEEGRERGRVECPTRCTEGAICFLENMRIDFNSSSTTNRGKKT